MEGNVLGHAVAAFGDRALQDVDGRLDLLKVLRRATRRRERGRLGLQRPAHLDHLHHGVERAVKS